MATPIDREAMVPGANDLTSPPGHPFDSEIAAEREGWYELIGLVQPLGPDEADRPGYYHDPDWSVADLVAHVGTWLAEAGNQLEQIGAGTYEPRDLDIDTLNEQLRAAMSGQPWEVILTQAQASRSRMLEVWYALPVRTDAAAWWVAKAGAEHYREHLGRLRAWVGAMVVNDGRPGSPGPPGRSGP